MVETDDVRDTLDNLSTVEFETSDRANGIRVAVDESEAGSFFKQVRLSDFEADCVRLNGTILAHIEAEESNTLRELFG